MSETLASRLSQETNERISLELADEILKDVGKEYLDSIGWTDADTNEFVEFIKKL